MAAAGVTLALVVGLSLALFGLQRAEQQARRAQQNLYVSQINLAQRSLGDGNKGLARKLLTAHIPEVGSGEDLRGWEWHYLWNQLSFDAAFKLDGHADMIRSVAYSPNGRLLVSADFGGHILLRDVEHRELLRTWNEPHSVHDTCFYSDDYPRHV